MDQPGRVLSFLSITIALTMGAKVEVPTFMLNNGRSMPAIALGTYFGFDQNSSALTPVVRDVVTQAIDKGYRHFDTASIYNTEEGIGVGISTKIAEGAVNREELFLTTKLWNTDHWREQVPIALRRSLSQLRSNYVDLYLMHWPVGLNEDYTFSNADYMETWRGLEDVARYGLAKAIGVSNFNITQLKRVLKEGSIRPAVIQIEVDYGVSRGFGLMTAGGVAVVCHIILVLNANMLHPQNVQEELVSYAQSEGIVVMGYSPFGSLVSRYGMTFPGPKIDDPILSAIAKKYGKTTPQVVLRWLVERNIVPIPKTVKPKRLEENINIFDFVLEKNEIEKISQFDMSKGFTIPSFWQDHPYYPFDKITNPISDPFRKN